MLFALAVLPTAADAAKQPREERPAATSKAKPKAKAKSKAKAPARAQRAKAPPRKAAASPPRRPSVGQLSGLHLTDDPLDLKSSVALVVDQETDRVLFSKNSEAVLPIASITKLMTALVVTEAGLSMDEVLTVSQEDVDTEKGSRSRLAVGTRLTRGEMLHLALMSSENRAAHALGRHYPGGLPAFVEAMNAKAHLLGMHDTRYVEPTGLSSGNRSSAHDLTLLVKATSDVPLIRELSTSREASVAVGSRLLHFRTTNGLVLNPEWEIGLQKTGYISEAGRCLVMQAQVAGRRLILVLLDSAGRYSRIGDAERIRKWLGESGLLEASSAPAVVPLR
ncbi:MAG: D-alanyl-D-alanine endopeptidase [Rubrivivax sp.]|nr:D-alanyl-D-alanine endopeptidase [Rubrivivax sp.]